jgi:hypothetical protein
MSRPCATHYRVVGPELSSAERHIPTVQELLVQLTTALSSPPSTRASQCHRPLGSQPNVSVGHTGTVRAGLHGLCERATGKIGPRGLGSIFYFSE